MGEHVKDIFIGVNINPTPPMYANGLNLFAWLTYIFKTALNLNLADYKLTSPLSYIIKNGVLHYRGTPFL